MKNPVHIHSRHSNSLTFLRSNPANKELSFSGPIWNSGRFPIEESQEYEQSPDDTILLQILRSTPMFNK